MEKALHLGLSIIKFIGLIILVIVVNVLPMRFLLDGQRAPLFLEVLLVLGYLLVVFWLLRTLWKKYQSHLSERVTSLRFGWRDFGFALLFFLAGRVLAILGTLLNFYLSGQEMSMNDAALEMVSSQMNLSHPFFSLLYPVTLTVIAPIVEEIVFRGFGSVLFFKKPVGWLGAFVTSFIFAMLHVNFWTELPTYLVLGLVLYAAYARRGSLKDSVAVHVLNNLPSALLFLVSLFIG